MINTPQIATGVIQLIEVGRDIYKATANQLVQKKKKKWVLAPTEILIKESGKVTYFVQKILRRKDK